jgi:TonB family protein
MNRKLMRGSCVALISIVTAVCIGPLSLAEPQAENEEVYDLHKAGENGITAPKPLYHPNPEYTDKARRKKISGTVLVSLVVTPEGTVRDAKITTSLDKDLDDQALKAVRTWKFDPATKEGKPVAVRIAVEVSFRVR